MSRLAILFCFMLAPFVSAFAEPVTPVNRPNLKVGDRWVFRTINLNNNDETSKFEQKITGVSEDVIRLEQKTKFSSGASSSSPVENRQADRSTWTFPDPRISDGKYVFLSFPLEVGKSWKNEYKLNRSGQGVTAFSSPVKVEGWEEVQVPAGSFKALKIVHSGNYNANNFGWSWVGSSSETVWYAPELKIVVKSELIDTQARTRTRTELVEYEIK